MERNEATLRHDIDTRVVYICAQPRVHKENDLSLCHGLSVQNTPHRHELTFPYTIDEGIFLGFFLESSKYWGKGEKGECGEGEPVLG